MTIHRTSLRVSPHSPALPVDTFTPLSCHEIAARRPSLAGSGLQGLLSCDARPALSIIERKRLTVSVAEAIRRVHVDGPYGKERRDD